MSADLIERAVFMFGEKVLHIDDGEERMDVMEIRSD